MKGQTKKYINYRVLKEDDQSLLREFLTECKDEQDKTEITELIDSATYLRDWKSFRSVNAWDKIKNKIEDKPRINWYKYAAVVLVFVFSLVAINYLSDTAESIYSDKSGKNIVLKDGSDIFLGANTEIEYNKNFNSENRTLELKGNAYFDIAKNPNVPFIIKTENVEIRVVGTKFYVSRQKNGIRVDVLEGKVKISNKFGKSHVITENQSAMVSDEINLKQLDPAGFSFDTYIDLKFDNVTVQAAIDSLNSIYKKEVIIINKDLKDIGTETIHTTIRNSSVKDFTRFMEIVFDVNVINSKGQYIISSK